jgi:ABC-type nickel/cobalt efflux system permease component RcnA
VAHDGLSLHHFFPGLIIALVLLAPTSGSAHPMGNFSISHYTCIRIGHDAVDLHYIIDMAEIPTFQEIQETGIVPQEGHASLDDYLARKAEVLKEGLLLDLNGHRLTMRPEASEVIFPPGAGGLPTMKVRIKYRAQIEIAPSGHMNRLDYHDTNFPGRAGWKEIIALVSPAVALVNASVPDEDRSLQLTDYPTDLLNSPPQVLEAHLVFAVKEGPESLAAFPGLPAREAPSGSGPSRTGSINTQSKEKSFDISFKGGADLGSAQHVPASGEAVRETQPDLEPTPLQGNRQATPRSLFTELVATKQLSLSVVIFALIMASCLGALHALEPGHGKTIVAAYLVGSRGTAGSAVLLGIIVTASHTAGVYLLGLITLYASHYVVPDRLYPWLGMISGLIIASMGLFLFFDRYGRDSHSHANGRLHSHGHTHGPGLKFHTHGHEEEHRHAEGPHPHHHEHQAEGVVSFRSLLTLGVTGGIIPCPAALVVLLSAIALRRVGFGLLLIVAFSMGLAAVLIAIGLVMVYARRFLSRFSSDTPLITRWLPVTSAAFITLFGVAMAIQGLIASGILVTGTG